MIIGTKWYLGPVNSLSPRISIEETVVSIYYKTLVLHVSALLFLRLWSVPNKIVVHRLLMNANFRRRLCLNSMLASIQKFR